MLNNSYVCYLSFAAMTNSQFVKHKLLHFHMQGGDDLSNRNKTIYQGFSQTSTHLDATFTSNSALFLQKE